MISPAFATMLCFVQTDAALAPETADLLLGVCVKRSFDRISVDGQLSTNDTAILMASGASGVRIAPESEDEVRFGEALDYLLRRLALLIARDGEGAARVGRVVVHGGHEPHVIAAARAVGELAAGQGGAARRRPQLGADRAGGRPGAARRRAAAARHLDRGRAGLRARARRCPTTSRRSPRAVAGEEVEYTVGAARRGRRGRGVLLRPLARVRDDQRGVHDVSERAGDMRRHLLEALPYIREFHGRTVVIKYGGAAMTDPALREDFARDVVLLKYVGLNPIVVHGGGPDITAYMQRLDMPVEFVGGLRVSDEDTVEIAKMVLVGKVNKDIVMRLNRHGQPAVGLSGDDGQLFRVATMEGPGGEDIGLVGRIERVDADVIHHIAEDYIPVIASVGADRAGRSHNVNADEAAGAVARATGAYKVIFLTDVPGWLRDPADPTSVISECGADEVEAALPTGSPAGCGRSCRPASTRSTAASRSRTSSTAASRTRCCSSCSRTPASARRSGPPRERARPDLRPLPGRVRLRLRLRAARRRRRRVPRLPRRDRGLLARALPSGGRRGGAGAGGAADARLEPVHQRADAAAGRAAGRPVVRGERLLRQLRRRGQRGGAQARPQGAPARRHRRRPRRLPRAHLRRAVGDAAGVQAGAVRAARAGLPRGAADRRGASRRRSTSAPPRCCSSRSRASPACTRSATDVLGAAREACDRAGAALVFDEVQCGVGRTGIAVGLRADRRRARRDDARQGPRRRHADRRAR